jgi:hypothetical protein
MGAAAVLRWLEASGTPWKGSAAQACPPPRPELPPFHDVGRMAETLRLLEAVIVSSRLRFSFVPTRAVREP